MTVVREAGIDRNGAESALRLQQLVERRGEPHAKLVLMDRDADGVAEHVGEVKWGAADPQRQYTKR